MTRDYDAEVAAAKRRAIATNPTGGRRPPAPQPTAPAVVDLDAAEIHSAAVMAAQMDHAAALDRRWAPLDDLCRSAYQAQAALLFVPGAAFDVVPTPPPGDDLPTWPEVRP
jgi:hypothetical protein